MTYQSVLDRLRRLTPDLTAVAIPMDDLVIALPHEHIRDAVQTLLERCTPCHLSAITGQETEEEIELLYHFWNRRGVTLRIALPLANPTVHTITDLIPGAAFYEREAAEMLGISFEGHQMQGFFLLPDDWNEGTPLRKTTQGVLAPGGALSHGGENPASKQEGQRGEDRSSTSPMIIPIGPQHPLLKEPLSFMLSIEGERVVSGDLRLGYVHRGIERLTQERSYVQNVHLLERVCGICSHVHTTAYCQGVEALLSLRVPPRGLYLRTLLCELERIHSHLLWLGVLAENIGFSTIFMYAWNDREIVLDMMEMLSGGRITHSVNVIGGVRIDVEEKQVRAIRTLLGELEQKLTLFLQVIEHDRTLRARTQDVGHLTPQQVRRYGAVGPVARASGVDIDLRRDAPYAVYDLLHVQVVTHGRGDVWARTLVRTQEMVESVRLCHQLLDRLPDGPTAVRAPRRVPPGEVIARAEAPRG